MGSTSNCSVIVDEPLAELNIESLEIAILLYRYHTEVPKGALTEQIYRSIVDIRRKVRESPESSKNDLDRNELKWITHIGKAAMGFNAAEGKKVLALTREYELYNV
jgi:hypothetical protein